MAARAATEAIMSELTVGRLTHLEPRALRELADHGRESLGEAALDEWMLPVIAAWGFLYTAEHDGEVIGSAQVIRCVSEGDLYMDIFYIRPKFRRKRHGTAFIREVLRRLGGHGYSRLLATVAPGNTPALAFYDASGFKQTGELPDFYGEGKDRLLVAASLADGGGS